MKLYLLRRVKWNDWRMKTLKSERAACWKQIQCSWSKWATWLHSLWSPFQICSTHLQIPVLKYWWALKAQWVYCECTALKLIGCDDTMPSATTFRVLLSGKWKPSHLQSCLVVWAFSVIHSFCVRTSKWVKLFLFLKLVLWSLIKLFQHPFNI